MLSVRGLTRPGVLDRIDLDIRRGEIVGICGMAGSGRTELLRALAGADAMRADSYAAPSAARPPASPREAIRRGIVLLPEDRKTAGCFLPQSVAFNISVARLAPVLRHGLISESREQRVVAELVRRLGVRTPGTGTAIRNLSGGNQQKCLIARSLNAGCSILLIDEPTRGVDVGAKREIYQLLAELADRHGAAIVMVSSELPEILGLSDRILVMRDGRVAARFEREEASEEKILAAAVGTEARELAA